MAEITRRRAGELVRGVFHILVKHPDGLQAKEVIQQLEHLVPPTEFEQSIYPNSQNIRRYGKIVRFSTIAAVKAGWLTKEKGLWSITNEGQNAFDKFRDPEAFQVEAGRLYRKWKAAQPKEKIEDEETDSESAATALEEAEETAWAEIEEFLEKMSPYDFQDLCAGLLRGMGYFVEWVSPPGPDKGIDIIAHVDPLGVKGPRIKAQVKRKAERVAVDGVRAFMALLADSDVGIFICTGGFTREAESEVRRQEKRRIMLIDLKRLFDLWTEHYEKIPDAQKRLLPLRAVYYLVPDE